MGLYFRCHHGHLALAEVKSQQVTENRPRAASQRLSLAMNMLESSGLRRDFASAARVCLGLTTDISPNSKIARFLKFVYRLPGGMNSDN
jgi:hypothetical protein